MARSFFSGDGNVLELDSSDGCTARWLYWEPLKCTFKIVDFMLREVYLNFKMLLKIGELIFIFKCITQESAYFMEVCICISFIAF